MTEFESPFMRDLAKLEIPIFYGILGALVFIFLFLWPFNVQMICNNGMVTTQDSIIRMVISDMTGVCF